MLFYDMIPNLKEAIPRIFTSWGRALGSLSLRDKNNIRDGFPLKKRANIRMLAQLGEDKFTL